MDLNKDGLIVGWIYRQPEFFLWKKQYEEGMSMEKYFTLENFLYLKQNCNNNNYTLNWLRGPGIVCRGIIVILHVFNGSFQVKFFLWMSHGIFDSINVYSVFVNILLFLEWLNNHFLFCLTENDVKAQDENEYFLQLYIFSASPWEDPSDDSNCFGCFICHPCHLWSWNIFFFLLLLF